MKEQGFNQTIILNMDLQLFLSIVLWLMIGSATAYFAHQRGRDPWIWFMIGMLLGLLGLLLLFILSPVKEEGKPAGTLSEDSEIAMMELDPEPHTAKELPSYEEWYYYDRNKVRQGPVQFETLKQLWSSGEIHEETFLWKEGLENWKKIESLPELYSKLLHTV